MPAGCPTNSGRPPCPHPDSPPRSRASAPAIPTGHPDHVLPPRQLWSAAPHPRWSTMVACPRIEVASRLRGVRSMAQPRAHTVVAVDLAPPPLRQFDLAPPQLLIWPTTAYSTTDLSHRRFQDRGFCPDAASNVVAADRTSWACRGAGDNSSPAPQGWPAAVCPSAREACRAYCRDRGASLWSMCAPERRKDDDYMRERARGWDVSIARGKECARRDRRARGRGDSEGD